MTRIPDPSPESPDSLLALLNAAPKERPGGARRRWWLLGGSGGVLLAGLTLLAGGGNGASGKYVTEAVTMGELQINASASGTLQPTKSVDVGSELSGTLASVLVQENDRVSKGQLLAQLDTAKLKDTVAKSRAAVASADAAVALAAATVAESHAALARMRQVAALSGGKVPAQTELEAAEASAQRALANAASARADVVQARATLKTDETNLAKATIRSPVDGVVLTRKVEPGQTVAAAMTTPVLFVLAEDLSRMELQVKVDEADVGNVKVGQPATFTVSAWPGRKFPAVIQRIGLGATTTDNVVTYKTVLHVDNDDLALRPGMTASASIVTAERTKALLVPNAALRFTPPASPEPEGERSLLSRLLPGPPPEAQKKRPPVAKTGDEARVWVLGDGGAQPVALKTGVSDGRHTEVLGGDLQVGMMVITDYRETRK